MLNCEKNTTTMQKRILRAYHAHYGNRRVNAFYEHGQWWIDYPRTGAQWSVNDAEGPGSAQGFCFERVSQGDDDSIAD